MIVRSCNDKTKLENKLHRTIMDIKNASGSVKLFGYINRFSYLDRAYYNLTGTRFQSRIQLDNPQDINWGYNQEGERRA